MRLFPVTTYTRQKPHKGVCSKRDSPPWGLLNSTLEAPSYFKITEQAGCNEWGVSSGVRESRLRASALEFSGSRSSGKEHKASKSLFSYPFAHVDIFLLGLRWVWDEMVCVITVHCG